MERYSVCRPAEIQIEGVWPLWLPSSYEDENAAARVMPVKFVTSTTLRQEVQQTTQTAGLWDTALCIGLTMKSPLPMRLARIKMLYSHASFCFSLSPSKATQKDT